MGGGGGVGGFTVGRSGLLVNAGELGFGCFGAKTTIKVQGVKG